MIRCNFVTKFQSIPYQAVKRLTVLKSMLRLKNLKVKKYAKATYNSLGVLIYGVPLKSDDGESGAGIVILRMLE